MKISKFFKSVGVAAALTASSFSYALGNNINANDNDVVLHGYDPVAYFTKSKAVKGSGKYSANHEGAIYHFSSKSNRDKFKSNPEKYAPQFGGYCAMGVVLNKKLDVDPDAWYIDGGKLYMNLNKTVQKKWLEEVSDNIATGHRTWNGIEHVSAKVLADE